MSILELTLKAKGKKTELTMIHSKVPEEQADYYVEGWKEYYWKPPARVLYHENRVTRPGQMPEARQRESDAGQGVGGEAKKSNPMKVQRLLCVSCGTSYVAWNDSKTGPSRLWPGEVSAAAEV